MKHSAIIIIIFLAFFASMSACKQLKEPNRPYVPTATPIPTIPPMTCDLKMYGFTAADGVAANAAGGVCVSNIGGFAICGHTMAYGGGEANGLIVKVDASGNCQWARQYGSGSGRDEWLYNIIQTQDNGYLAGGFDRTVGSGSMENVYLVKTDAFGNSQWAKYFSPGYMWWSGGMYATLDGGCIMACKQGGFAIIKLDSSFNISWQTGMGLGSSADSVIRVSDGGYVAVGSSITPVFRVMALKVDASGNCQWSRAYPDYSAQGYGQFINSTSDGGIIISGNGGTGNTCLLIKADASGNCQWARTYSFSSFDHGTSVHQTTDSGYIVTGRTSGAMSDIEIFKVDASGNVLWTKTYGCGFNDYANDSVLLADGVVIAGYSEINPGAFLFKSDLNGNRFW